jgi:hypothetical protein
MPLIIKDVDLKFAKSFSNGKRNAPIGAREGECNIKFPAKAIHSLATGNMPRAALYHVVGAISSIYPAWSHASSEA